MDYTSPTDACSYVWDKIKNLQPPYIQRLASNVSLVRKSREDADADRLAREQELLGFEDTMLQNDTKNDNDDNNDNDMIPYRPRIMSKLELFYAYHIIMAKWKAHQPNDLRVNSLVPLPVSLLQADDSLSYFEDSVLNLWKLQFKHLSRGISKEQHLDLLETYQPRIKQKKLSMSLISFPLRTIV